MIYLFYFETYSEDVNILFILIRRKFTVPKGRCKTIRLQAMYVENCIGTYSTCIPEQSNWSKMSGVNNLYVQVGTFHNQEYVIEIKGVLYDTVLSKTI